MEGLEGRKRRKVCQRMSHVERQSDAVGRGGEAHELEEGHLRRGREEREDTGGSR
jgi:hypothetical protein